MWTIIWLLRLTVALGLHGFVISENSTVTSYPLEVQQMVQQRLAKGQQGSWSSWSKWTTCSRTCGGGVTIQTRDCHSKPQGRHRRRVHSSTMRNHCIGLYKRIHVCNTEECPGGGDIRQKQCESYNGKLFLGRAYTWEPFLDAPNQCSLNCRAQGFRFYATLNSSVEDGTSCRGYVTSPNSGKWICIDGYCKHVGCDGVVGSDKHVDTCGVCGGDNSTCRIISGIFTRPQLPVGYNLITQIPQAACNLTITELKQSRNYLALRRPDGSFILNGNWAINWSGEYHAAGSKFMYMREDENNAESITSPGPLQEPLDLMLIYQQPNPGIKYQYQLPMQKTESTVYPAKDDPVVAPPLLRHSQGSVPSVEDQSLADNGIDTKSRHNKPMFPYGNGILGTEIQGYSGDEAMKPRTKIRKRKVAWKITGYTECSKSCGGGTQTPIFACVREHNQMIVSERRCASLEKPTQKVRCNVKPCVAEWVGGDWSECSVSCGEGVQTREIICRQEISPTLIMTVAEGACLTPPSPLLHRTRVCHQEPCSGAPYEGLPPKQGEWVMGAWSQCSTECGLGIRTRSVLCPSGDCPLKERPTTESVCDMGECQPQASEPHTRNWFYTEWSHECSEGCGTGVQTRKVHCSGLEFQCDQTSKPESARACSSDKQCGGQWYTGPWGQCSATCGLGRQSRSVVCVTKLRGELVITTDNHCLASEKPILEQQCHLQSCKAEWYSADWTQCSRSCDTGVQRREVRCLDGNQVLSNDCTEDMKPPTRRSCNSHYCPVADEASSTSVVKEQSQVATPTPTSDTQSPGDQAHQVQHSTAEDGDCVDKFHNCHLVVQARLCKYKYYRGSCCQACRTKA